MVKQKHKIWFKKRSDTDKAEYRREYINLNKSIKIEKIKWENELASRAKHNPKLIYSYIRSKKDVKEQIKALKEDEGRLTVKKSAIADILNNHFESMFIKKPPDPLPEFENKTYLNFGTERVLTKINEFEIGKSLKCLKQSKSMGPDKIHPMILKECALEFAKPLKILFLESIKHGKIPNSWRFANISLILKKYIEPCAPTIDLNP